jgi:hypothetical protein
MEEAIFSATVIELFAEISNRWNAKKRDSTKENEGRPGSALKYGKRRCNTSKKASGPERKEQLYRQLQ